MSDGDRGTERNVTLIIGLVLLAVGVSALFTGRLFPFGGFPAFWRISREIAGPAGLILIGAAALYFSQRTEGRVRAPERGRRLYRDESRKMISGVIAGLSDYFGIDVTVLRLAAVGLGLLNPWGAFIAYVVAAAIVPVGPPGGEGSPPPSPPGQRP